MAFLLSLFLLSTALPFTLQQVCFCTTPPPTSTDPRPQQIPLFYFCINGRGNFTANSTFSSNLDRLAFTLSSAATSPGGFFNFSIGQQTPADTVNSIALCRGDVPAASCRDCTTNAIAELRRSCPNQKEAVIWYDSCMVRYSTNSSIYGTLENGQMFYMWNRNNVTSTSVQDFNQVLSDLLDRLRVRAAGGDSTRKFATGNSSVGNFQRIYALVQCTPDLSELQCSSCLTQNFGQIPLCCDGKIGGRVVGPSCNFRYEVYPFYDPSPDAPPPQPPTHSLAPPPLNGRTGNKGSSSRTPLVTVVAIVAFLAISAFGCTLLLRQWKETKIPEEIENGEAFQFKFSKIKEATNDFSEENKLGQGGFGVVYKGKLQNGQDVAVKRLSKNSNQGRKEFENEVQLLAKLQHRNLVRLLGFSIQGAERLLVYEFLPLSSLEKYISDPTKSLLLDWDIRYKIITDIARGTLYLHEDSQFRIIHRDLKPSNILLDADMNPKISDFGMAKLFPTDITQAHASRVVGTLGYMAPEYVQNGQVSVKTDVYSFGVLVMEIISGQRINHFSGEGEEFNSLLSYVWENWKKGTIQELLDPNLRGAQESEVMRCIHLALLCVQENAANRPYMATVVLMLSSSVSMPMPLRPAFLLHSLMPPERPPSTRYGAQVTELEQSENENIQFSNNEASFSEIAPR